MSAVPVREAIALASERAAVQFPHGTNDVDALAKILRGALADLAGKQPTAGSLLREFIVWRDRVQGEAGCNYLNGDGDDGADAWQDLDSIAEAARSPPCPRITGSREVSGASALNVADGLYVDAAGHLYPITNWFDEDGDECPREVAVSCVAGEGGCWFALNIADFSETPCR